ncbi:TIGR02594 family protein [Hymenobacter lapidiphilus]|uniref:TIGR02594 family protein n=1 Tax=Hymenobacter sp. CCM 8763 TaxID=2303334 RepID=UPI000E3509ED|nr:TIGR02594 family protein [Hymenobacter sp. CCM 8763]RFP63482.1 TIGR02594 family protein [Hymenobacter sp. CCM 8763]
MSPFPLPKRFAYLAAETGPRILLEALALHGTKEIIGGQHSPEIMSWLRELRFDWITSDEVPWCGTALAIAAVRAGVAVRHPEMPRAFWWAGWGSPVAVPMLGDVVVLSTSHVGIYVGEDATRYYLLGGNQANSHNISGFPKSWLKSARRSPWKVAQPANVRRIWVNGSGVATAPTTR